MFILSQLLISDNTYSIIFAMSIYVSITVYIATSTDYISVFAKIIPYIILVDLMLSGFYLYTKIDENNKSTERLEDDKGTETLENDNKGEEIDETEEDTTPITQDTDVDTDADVESNVTQDVDVEVTQDVDVEVDSNITQDVDVEVDSNVTRDVDPEVPEPLKKGESLIKNKRSRRNRKIVEIYEPLESIPEVC